MNSQKGFWWYFIRVTLFAIAFFVGVLLLSDWNYGDNTTVARTWDVNTISFWLVSLLYIAVVFAVLSLITILIMKLSKLANGEEL